MEARQTHSPARDVEQDIELVREFETGSVAAWHAFVDRYSGLILSIVQRYLVRESEDDRRTLFVGVLKDLYEGKLSRYDGRASLATWVAVVTRGRCLDFIRHLHGRRDSPRWLRGCTEIEQEIYRLYFLEGSSYRAICEGYAERGTILPVAELAETLSRLEARMDRRTKRRVAYDLEARKVGATSGRLLHYLDHLREEIGLRVESQSPEALLEGREIEAGLERLSGLLRQLPQLENKVLSLHYFEGLTAREIAAQMELSGQRRAYTLIDRALRKLRALFQSEVDEDKLVGRPKRRIRSENR